MILEHEKLYSDIYFLLKDVVSVSDIENMNWVAVFSLYETQLDKIKKQAQQADNMRRNGR